MEVLLLKSERRRCDTESNTENNTDAGLTIKSSRSSKRDSRAPSVTRIACDSLGATTSTLQNEHSTIPYTEKGTATGQRGRVKCVSLHTRACSTRHTTARTVDVFLAHLVLANDGVETEPLHADFPDVVGVDVDDRLVDLE